MDTDTEDLPVALREGDAPESKVVSFYKLEPALAPTTRRCCFFFFFFFFLRESWRREAGQTSASSRNAPNIKAKRQKKKTSRF
jgi:hypothetical protein